MMKGTLIELSVTSPEMVFARVSYLRKVFIGAVRSFIPDLNLPFVFHFGRVLSDHSIILSNL
jgi:hypothetical protein